MTLTPRQRRILRILHEWDPRYVPARQVAYEAGDLLPNTCGQTLQALVRRDLVEVEPLTKKQRQARKGQPPNYGITPEGIRHLR